VAELTGRPGAGRSPDRSAMAKLGPPLIMVAVTIVGWLLLLPWDWSTVDATGRRTDRATSGPACSSSLW